MVLCDPVGDWSQGRLVFGVSFFSTFSDFTPTTRNSSPSDSVLIPFSADEAFDGTYPVNVVVYNTGACTYIPPGIFKSTCKIDITWFPFDDQDCNMKFGSWTYNGFKARKHK